MRKLLLGLALAMALPVFAAEHWIDVRVPQQYQKEHVDGAFALARLRNQRADSAAKAAALLRRHLLGSFVRVRSLFAQRNLCGGFEVGERADRSGVVCVHRLPVARRL